MIDIIYQDLCPVCNGDVNTEELHKNICYKKLKKLTEGDIFKNKEYDNFEKYFIQKTNFKPNSIQRYWAKKLLEGLSFTLTTPTGTGKTLFGMVYSSYISSKGKKSYIIVPTNTLLSMVYERLINIHGDSERIIHYSQKLKKKEKEEFLNKLNRGDFDILLTTSAYLSRNFERLKHLKFDFIFVDDVDAVLKNSKNIDRLLLLLGFSEDEIANGIKNDVNGRSIGQIVVSTATSKPGKKAQLFLKLLNFTIGSSRSFIRNVSDFGIVCNNEDEKIDGILKVIDRIGKDDDGGGLLFGRTEDECKYLYDILSKEVSCALITSGTSKKDRDEIIEKFLKSEYKLLIGVSSPYGLLVRGLDYPEVIKYCLFYNVPSFTFKIKDINNLPVKMLILLSTILRKYSDFLDKGLPLISRNSEIRGKVKEEIIKILEKNKIVEDGGIIVKDDTIIIPNISSYLQSTGRTSRLYAGGITKGVSFVFDSHENINALKNRLEYYGIEINVLNYGEIDKIDYNKLLQEIVESRKKYKSVNVSEDIIKPVLMVVESPTKSKQIGRFFGKPSAFIYNNQIFYEVLTEKNLLIITATMGHVCDLTENREYYGVKVIGHNNYEVGIDRDNFNDNDNFNNINDNFSDNHSNNINDKNNNFNINNKNNTNNKNNNLNNNDNNNDNKMNGKCNYLFIPIYGSIKRCLNDGRQFVDYYVCPICNGDNYNDSKDRIYNIMKIGSMVNKIILSSDPDNEGEKISYDIYNFTNFVSNGVRCRFNEITKNAIINGLNNPTDVDENLIKSQIVRRVEDRWIGFKLSTILKEHFGDGNYSAGRTQSPVLRWIVDRYREHLIKIDKYYLKVLVHNLTLNNNNSDNNILRYISIDLEEYRPILENIFINLGKRKKEIDCSITVNLKNSETIEKVPLPPYTTETVLEDLDNLYNISPKEGMEILQTLFENGLITYHRTDSTRVSDKGLEIAKKYLKEHFIGRKWITGEEGPHECIRPTTDRDWKTVRDLIYQNIYRTSTPITYKHLKVYDLIFRRFMFSQCENYYIVENTYNIEISTDNDTISIIEKMPVSGNGKAYELYPYGVKVKPELKEGNYTTKIVRIRKSKEPLYTQADIIRLMKERKIGRPSTYSTTLEKLFIRGYIIEKKGKLIPTKKGITVSDYLQENYKDFVSEDRTRYIEELMDKVEKGKMDYIGVLNILYNEVKDL